MKMLKPLVLGALIALAALPALAASCKPSLEAIGLLSGRYGENVIESRTFALSETPDFPVQWDIWHNPQTGSWSFTGTAGGITCLFNDGQRYQGETINDLLPGGDA